MTILVVGYTSFLRETPLFWQWEIHYKTHLSAEEGGKTNQLKNFAVDVWLKHWPSLISLIDVLYNDLESSH